MRDKRTMAFQFLRARKMRTRYSGFTNRNRPTGDAHFGGIGVRDETEADLPAARQLDIHLRKQLRVEERTMFDAQAPVHSEAGAKCVEAMLGTRMLRSRKH